MKKILDHMFLIFSFLLSLFFMTFLILSPVSVSGADKKPALQFSRNQEIQQIKPKKPVKIKLHRNAKGEYQWDITGDNADEIVRADRRLRKLLQVE
ncbi:MAG: hypothetical protein HY099_01285 [Nitrospirae bacterium]|nr:hypothetical protein [Nitrospirota bacterium]